MNKELTTLAVLYIVSVLDMNINKFKAIMNSTVFNHPEPSHNNGTTPGHEQGPKEGEHKGAGAEHGGGHHVPAETLVVYFLIIALFLGMLCRQVYRKYGISSSFLIFLIGLLLSLFLSRGESITGQAFKSVQTISVEGIF